MYQQMTLRKMCQWLLSQPIKQVIPVGCLQNIGQSITGMQGANTLRNRQQMQIVVTQHRQCLPLFAQTLNRAQAG